MKKYHYHIIIIITTILILSFALSLTVSARSEQCLVDSVSLSTSAGAVYGSVDFYDNFTTAYNNVTDKSTTIFPPSNHRDYDNFIVVDNIRVYTNDYYTGTLFVNWNTLDLGDSKINRVQFKFSAIGDDSKTAPSLSFLQNGTVISRSDYTLTFSKSTYVYAGAVDVDYNEYYCDVLFDFDLDLSVPLQMQLQFDFMDLDLPSSQIIGIDNLDVEYSTVSDYVADIKSEVTVLTDTTKENNKVLNEIFDYISTPTEDLTDQIGDLGVTLGDINTANDLAEAELQKIYKNYTDYEVDLYGADYWDLVVDNIAEVYNHEEYQSFWFGLWSLDLVSTLIVIVVAFAAAHFAIHGLR